jgi:hypothetical protein
MTVAPTQPPQTPVVIYSVAAGTGWTCTRSSGVALATNTTTPVAACAAALVAASVNPSTLVILYSPSSTPLWNGELADMSLVTGR